MKKVAIFLAAIALVFVMPCFANAQEAETPKEEGWIFSEEVKLPVTSVKNQYAAGTCWCYSSLSFVEAELLRMGKGEYDFREDIFYAYANAKCPILEIKKENATLEDVFLELTADSKFRNSKEES